MLVETLTGFGELLDGRVKTLHPAIHAAILARDDDEHRQALAALGIKSIDLVAVSLYPFETQALAARLSMADALELIDIGGVAMLRAAAKNWPRVAALSEIHQYGPVIEELRRTEGSLSEDTRRALAAEAFARTAAYDAAIREYFRPSSEAFPDRLTLTYRKVADMRYGENPHQRAAFYEDLTPDRGRLPNAHQHQGKDLSFNNIADLDAAWGLVSEFATPAAAIIKHATPCGVATAASLVEAYANAHATDPTSAFGGVVAFNRPVDEATAAQLTKVFTEAVIAPGYSSEGRSVLARRSNLRVMEVDAMGSPQTLQIRTVAGGVLVQEADASDLDESRLTVATERAPTDAERRDLRFAWTVAKWVKSNAIVLAKNGMTVGVGSGQPNRVGAVEIAVHGAGERARGAVMASDAFFPFRDGIDVAAQAGVSAVIQPGGSVRDAEVIAAANVHKMAMVLTGIRHFRH
jgi:phosphoribosylaminoimidazolecarboxamide formyltransferase/IMP cyclohydrolase